MKSADTSKLSQITRRKLTGVHSDEPELTDRLERETIARAFADLAGDCNTPLVIGIFGSWGSGKTTFLRLVEKDLDKRNCKAVWFNAWEHDQDDAPAVSLLHKLVDVVDANEEFKSGLKQIALAFGSLLLKKTTSLDVSDLEKAQSILDDENFRVRDARNRLRSHFEAILDKAGVAKGTRLVFFIDDLDRCSPQCVLRILEAIKLYFNLPGCVFFLNIDRDNLENILRNASTQAQGSESHYLDKMIQLPFVLPQVAQPVFQKFLEHLLPADLQVCLPLMLNGLDSNPRSAKRFINNLVLRHYLALSLGLANYDPQLVALLLLFEQNEPELFRAINKEPALLRRLKDDPNQAEQHIASERLRLALTETYVPAYASTSSYLSLTNLDLSSTLAQSSQPNVPALLEQHKQWLLSFRHAAQRADIRGANLVNGDLQNRQLREAGLAMADLSGSDLSGSDLRRADLADANLSEANLSDANLRFADLRECDLSGANLYNADFRGANMIRSNLRNTSLRFTLGLNEEQLKDSLINEYTLLPDHLAFPMKEND